MLQARSGTVPQQIAFIADRGLGKTVLMNELSGLATDANWAVVWHQARSNQTNLTKMLRVVARAWRGMPGELGEKTKQFVDTLYELSVTLANSGISGSRRIREVDVDTLFGEAVSRITEHAAEHDSGVAFFFDEVQRFDVDELEAIGAALSEANRLNLPTMTHWAGLPGADDHLIGAISYANRIRFVELGPLTELENQQAIVEPFRSAGVSFDPRVTEELWSMSHGFPYLTQVTGSSLWAAADLETGVRPADVPTARSLSFDMLRRKSAQQEAWSSMPDMEQRYAAAVAQLGHEASTTAIAEALEKDSLSDVSVYRSRLIARGVLEAPRRGWVRLTYPLTRDFVLHSAVEKGYLKPDVLQQQVPGPRLDL